ncbi:TetR/AcrR family transcriptional regulator [Paragemmobacter straminiformis]|uniref:TetR/AcrR family transcriptional regulator n=1 Tax=Paragemmobacter straminiformis TaxID=2045119 RepID=A0A842IAT9_9RHOB|nr:TetR/AcrR family transcriptional regulator [Gemmobacter straminiformis]MBC2836709.1 TetR/AcrR family transcriptional regulator [Gemmobacter straminiformis]
MTAPSRREQNRMDRTRRILDGALRVFAQAGYSGTTMDAVAAAAGLSKPTLYQYFPSKEDLFQAMMLGLRDKMMAVFDHPSPKGMVHDLHAFAWDYADAVMQPEMLSLARLIIGEVQRFPEIGRAYQASGPDRLLAGIMAYLELQRAAGRLAFDDAELAAQDLWGLILSAPRTQALYQPDTVPNRHDLARYVTNGLRVFLRAYSTSPEDDLLQLEALASARTTGDEE